jgi:tetratricopeptide (TPR) repeat protein
VARRLPDNPTAQTLEEIEHLGDRIVEAVSNNPRPILLVIGAILLAAAVWGGWSQMRGGRLQEAASALDQARIEYAEAMGGSFTALEIPEPANPETARRVRSEFAERYAQIAAEHAGTPTAALALLEAGNLRAQLGEPEAALESWRTAAAAAEGPLRALVLERIGQAEEDAGRFAEAAASYERAGGIQDYPLRYQALGAAARSYAEAGQTDQALALYKRIQAESPETRLAPHVAARLRELEAAATLSGSVSGSVSGSGPQPAQTP